VALPLIAEMQPDAQGGVMEILLAWASWPPIWVAASICAVIALLLLDKEMHFDEDVWG
jgi:hypothetical protein